jgi:hypothetical protein
VGGDSQPTSLAEELEFDLNNAKGAQTSERDRDIIHVSADQWNMDAQFGK